MLRLSRASGIPLYLQAISAVRDLIAREGLARGDRLPSLDALAERFGIARLTMRQAIKRLEEEGVVVSRRGQGITVRQTPPTPPKMRVQADVNEFMSLSRGSVVHTLLQEDVTGCPLLESAPQDIVYRHWMRVHTDSDVPYGFLNLYLAHRYYIKNPVRFDAEPTMHVTTELPELDGAVYNQRLTIRTAYAEEAEHLRITPGVPVAHVLRTGRDADGEVFFVATVVYPGNQLQIDMNLQLHK